MTEPLKNCPFCGAGVRLLQVETWSVQPDDYHSGYVTCQECDAQGARPEQWLGDKASADEAARIAWNTRAALSPPSTGGEGEAVAWRRRPIDSDGPWVLFPGADSDLSFYRNNGRYDVQPLYLHPSPEMGEISREAAKRSSERLNSFVSSTISKAQTAAGDTEGGTGWLVEGWNARTGEFKACWWGLGDAFEERFGWTTDSTKALRFAREIDAQEYIVEAGWTDAKPTEHVWGSVRPYPVDYLGKVIESAISESLSGDWETARDAAVTLILSKLKENGLSREELGGSARASRGAACPSDCAENDQPSHDGEDLAHELFQQAELVDQFGMEAQDAEVSDLLRRAAKALRNNRQLSDGGRS